MGPGVLLPLARLLGLRPSVFTFHSFDYRRSKWGPGARAFLRFSEWVSIRSSDAVIAVSEAGTEHIMRRYRRSVRHIPNGPGRLRRRAPGEVISRLGLTPGGYVLAVGRLSPEKCLEDLIIAQTQALPRLQLVLVGDTSYTDEYIARLRALAGPGVIFPGYLQGEALEELYSCALIYAITSEIEGLSVSLLEAMSLGCAVSRQRHRGQPGGAGRPAGRTHLSGARPRCARRGPSRPQRERGLARESGGGGGGTRPRRVRLGRYRRRHA